jgi:4-amino-4-deoxy-L-arabinose transferase-like glycosyltransferase
MSRSRVVACGPGAPPAGAAAFPAVAHPVRTPATTAADWRAFGWLMAAALLVLGAGLGLRDPWPSDEPRFALVARQMVESGDWWFPRRGSELYSDKPPMLMWLQALSFQLTGHWRIAFGLPSLLAGLGTLALVWDLGRRLWSPRIGLLAAVAVLSAFMFTFQFKRAQIDPLVTFLITLANWGLLRHLLLGPHWRAFWLGCFAAGLGVITKGVGAIALLMLLPWALARRAGWHGLAHTAPQRGDGWRWAAGALAFLGAIALWLVPVATLALARGTPEYLAYLQDILFNQTARRYAGQLGGHESRPWWYFGPVLLLHFFPLSLAYGAGWHDARAAWRARDGRLAVLLGWCALVLLFFTLSGGKREVYILPMLPMLALALAPTLARIADARWLQRSAFACAVVIGIGLLAAGVLGGSGRWPGLDAVMAERGMAEAWPAVALLMAAIGALFLLAALAWRPRRGMPALLTGMAGLWLVWGLGVAPLANGGASAADVMRRADAVAGPDGEIALVAWKEQNRLMAPRPVQDFGFKRRAPEQFARAADWLHEAPARRWVFAFAPAVRACVDEAHVTRVGLSNRREWWMFQADALRPGCTPPDRPGAAADDEPD